MDITKGSGVGLTGVPFWGVLILRIMVRWVLYRRPYVSKPHVLSACST